MERNLRHEHVFSISICVTPYVHWLDGDSVAAYCGVFVDNLVRALLPLLPPWWAMLMGGRIAEGMFFGNEKVTTGASNDIERATELARSMVWLMENRLSLTPRLVASALADTTCGLISVPPLFKVSVAQSDVVVN